MFRFKWGKKLFLAKRDRELTIPDELFRFAFEYSGNASLLLKDLSIAWANQAAQKLLGINSYDITEKAFFSLLSGFEWKGFPVKTEEEFSRIFFSSDKEHVFNTWCKKADGRLFYSNIKIRPLIWTNTRYYFVDIKDITHITHEKEELTAYRWRMEKLVEEKTEELDTINQELQAAMEELNASNEELQANNEELFQTNERLAKEIELHQKTMAEKGVLEEKLKQFIHQSTNGFIILNDSGLVEEWSHSMFQIAGITGEYAIGKTMWQIVVEMVAQKAEGLEERFKEQTISFFNEIKNGTGRRLSFETQIKHTNSEVKTIEVLLYPIITEHTVYAGVIVSDITQRKNNETALEEYRCELEQLLEKNTERYAQLSERYNEIYKRSTNAIFFLDVEQGGEKLRVFDMNPVACQVFGITPDRIEKGLYVNELLSASTYDDFQEKYLPDILRGKVMYHTDEKNWGNGIWESTIIPIKDKDGKIKRIASVAQDVTIFHEYKKLSAIFNSAIDSWPYELWIADKHGKIVVQNKISQQNWRWG